MNDAGLIWRLSATGGTLVVYVVIALACRFAVHNYAGRKALNETRERFAKKIVNYLLFSLMILALIVIWGVEENVGLFVSSVIGLIAIGFFAVWSILSNIVAGFFLFFSDPFRVGDQVVILPENISGKAIDIKLLFVVLEDEDGSILHVPNNLLFQKVIKRRGRTSPPVG